MSKTETIDIFRENFDGYSKMVLDIHVKSDAKNHLVNASKNMLYVKAWCGMLKGEMGIKSPYQNDGKRKEVKDIEPTDAVNLKNGWDNFNLPEGDTTVIKIDTLRECIKGEINILNQISAGYNKYNKMRICIDNIYRYMCEARFELGFALGELRND